VNHELTVEEQQEIADFGAYLVLTGLGIFVSRDSAAGKPFCTIPSPHANFLAGLRVCGCPDCHARRTLVYQSAWTVSREARTISRLKAYDEL